ncbi:MAG: hypothetical protein AAGA62_09890, partial [Bacteroidota bacterium]
AEGLQPRLEKCTNSRGWGPSALSEVALCKSSVIFIPVQDFFRCKKSPYTIIQLLQLLSFRNKLLKG